MTTSPAATTTAVSELKTRIERRQARVAIIGLGYVGLPLALLFTEQKMRVTGFDIDQRKITTLTQGGTYIVRILASEIQHARSQGFEATSDYARLEEMDAIIICVPTPLNEYHEPDLSYITDTAKAIAPHLRAGQLVVLESTTYPGTTEEVMVPILEKGNKRGLKAARRDSSNGQEIYVAFSPEREDPGNTTVARRDIPKVVGGLDPQATELAAALYGTIFNRVVPRIHAGRSRNDQAAGEHLPLRQHCPGQRIEDALAAHGPGYLGSHRRGCHQTLWLSAFLPRSRTGRALYPHRPFLPFMEGQGMGFPHPLHRARRRDQYRHALPGARTRGKALNRHKKALNGAKVLVLGVAYKKDIDDLRESPALTVIELLQAQGAAVSYNDPFFATVGKGRKYDLQMTCAPLDNLGQYDCVLIVTDHSEYDYKRIVRESQLVVDTRNATKGIDSPKIVRC